MYRPVKNVGRFGDKRKLDIKRLLRVLIFLCIITIMLTATSSFFKLEKIEINGNVSIPDSEILNSVNHHLGENIFMIKPALISEEIKQSVPIKEVKVKLKLPRTLVINVEEREIAAALSYLGGFALIDSNGVVVRIEPELKGLMIPVITGLEISRAEKAKPLVISEDQSLLERLKEVMKLFSPMNAELSEIHIEKNREGVAFFIYTLDGYQVYFEETDIDEGKFALLREVLEDLRKNGRGKGLIDLSQDMPVFRPNISEEKGGRDN